MSDDINNPHDVYNDLANDPDLPNDLELRTTADGSKTLYSTAYKQTFHSDKGALAESRHVFIDGTSLPFRLRTQTRVRVLEVGFGTGLNFLLSAQEARKYASTLEYYALEKILLPRGVLEALDYHQLLADSEMWQHFLGWRQHLNLERVMTRSAHAFDWHNVHLKVLLGDARDRLLELGHVVRAELDDTASDYHNLIDVIYHDAFSFDANSELWRDAFLRHLFAVLAPGGVLTTYSVKGIVRRRLAAAGFHVDKVPGPPGGKREMLIAQKSEKGKTCVQS